MPAGSDKRHNDSDGFSLGPRISLFQMDQFMKRSIVGLILPIIFLPGCATLSDKAPEAVELTGIWRALVAE